MAGWRRIGAMSPPAILAIGWCVFVLYAYPGLMASDSFAQLADVRSGSFRDVDPPLMTLVWAILDWIAAGPFGMLILQSTSLLAGTYLIARRLAEPRAAAVCAVIVLLVPPVAAVTAVICTHALFAGLAVLGTGLLLDEQRRPRMIGLAVLAVAGGLRYNAAVATLPLVVMLFTWSARPRLQRYAIAGAAWLVTVLVALAANSLLTDREWQSPLSVMDVVGTIAHGDDLPDAELRATLAGTPLAVDRDIQTAARARGAEIFTLPQYGPMRRSERDALDRARHELVRSNLGAYVSHRLAVFHGVLGLGDEPWDVTTHDTQPREMLDELDVAQGYSKLQSVAGRGVVALSHTVVFAPWAYCVLALAMLVRFRSVLEVRVLLASGLAVELSLVYCARDSDYRSSHWLVSCVWLAAAILVARRWRR